MSNFDYIFFHFSTQQYWLISLKSRKKVSREVADKWKMKCPRGTSLPSGDTIWSITYHDL